MDDRVLGFGGNLCGRSIVLAIHRSGYTAGSLKIIARRRIAGDNIESAVKPAEVQIGDEQLISINKALSDPKRFEILQRVAAAADAPTCACARDWTGLSPATISHHIKELETAGLIQVERCGKFAHITLRRDVWSAYLKRLSQL
ncbi:MAG: winged helix-turn-helix transcriptional regulator [Acidobacteriota bacterium]|nr:winged helix-turn-helix transcriptional regulator [Acidobacteriota bacterium]